MEREGFSVTTFDRASGERFQSLRRQLGLASFGMNVIVLQPRQRGRIHAHERQEEAYVVLEGELTLIVDGKETVLNKHDSCFIGPNESREIVNRTNEVCSILVAIASPK
jgi:uncharacterized cupin superfamily protein